MPEISDEELEEYQHLKSIYTREAIQKSLNGITRLEDDIDAPIKKCVMAFALLGCEPIFSCCGFDYTRQPIHKFHQYGRCYFILQNTPQTLWLMNDFLMGGAQFSGVHDWEITTNSSWKIDLHLRFGNIIPQWDNQNTLHYSEQAVQFIQFLEEYLMSISHKFEDSAIIRDANWAYRNRFPYWQYPPKEDWLITKESLLKGVK